MFTLRLDTLCISIPLLEWEKLSHKQKKNRKNYEKRRQKRKLDAVSKEKEENIENDYMDPSRRHDLMLKEVEEEEKRKHEEKEWLNREARAQLAFLEKQELEEKRAKEKEELKQRIREEFEELEKTDAILAPDISKINSVDEHDRQAMLQQFDNLIEEAKEQEYSNPLAPSSYPQYGTELDVKYCSFYVKTGACRFGDRCSRHHMKPVSSDTILLPSMFHHISLGQEFTNDLDIDSGLEHEEDETQKAFTDFFWDVFPEFQSVGEVTMFKVCCNHEPHLRGNVYVQYRDEKAAIKAYAKFNGRFYASRQISCEFVRIEKWKSAICGQFHRNRCPKGKTCNFLHVFKNPGGLFMVHGSEVGPQRITLSAAGESAMRDLEHNPIVQAVRARFKPAGAPPPHPQNHQMSWNPRHNSPSPRRNSPSPYRRGRGRSPHRGRGTPSPASHRGRGTPSPGSHRGRGTPSPSYSNHSSPSYNQDKSRCRDKSNSSRNYSSTREGSRGRSHERSRGRSYDRRRSRSPRRKR